MQFKVTDFSSLSFHPDYRWDGEYLCFEPYKNPNLQYVPIGDTLTSSQYGVSIEMNEYNVGTKIYRMNEISNIIADSDVSKYADLSDREVDTYRLQDKDVLFNRTNSLDFVGRTGIFRKFTNEDIVFASYLVRLVPDADIVTPEYLTTFLNTKFGMLDVRRRARISINQSNVNPEELKRVEIPLLSSELQQKITQSFDSAFSSIKSSEARYQEAEALLLTELELVDWKPSRQTKSIRNFSDAWGAGRLDAEYYQPKYDDIVNAIKGYAGGWDTLGNLATMRKCVEVGSKEYLDEGIPFVRVSNITPFEITEEKYITEELYSQVAQHQPQQGEILLSKDATPGIAHYFDEQPDKMIPAGGILRLKRKSDKVNDEYLTLVLNSTLTQEQVNRDVVGSVILHWRPDQVAGTLIPILSQAKQTEIQCEVKEAVALRRQSRALLERAKRAVEIAIEDGEAAAMVWLEDAPKPPFRVKPNNSGLAEGVDPLHLNRLLDEFEIEDFLAKNSE